MNITKRLVLVFSLLVLSLIATNIIAIYSLTGIRTHFNYFQVNTLPSIEIMNKETVEVTAIRSRLFLHGMEENPDAMSAFQNKALKQYQELLASHKNYQQNYISDDTDRELTKSTLASMEALEPAMARYFALSENNDREALQKAMRPNGFMVNIIDDVIEKLGQQVKYNSELVQKAGQSNDALITRSISISVTATLLASLALGAFALLTVFNIRKRLNRMRSDMDAISHTLDFTHPMESGHADEIGNTISAFKQLLLKVSDALSVAGEASIQVNRAANEISSGNMELSSRTEQQSAAVVETAASMEELNSTVKQNAENAHQASQLAIAASENASHGGQIVGTVVDRMKDISDSSRRIAEITSVINGIAFQTNILALNAAVEAARAGDQGRGFAVVAGEVRSLAQRSAQAAKEIETLIQESVQHVEEGARQVDNAGEAMTGIVNSVVRVKDLMQEIAAASDEQNRGISQIAQAMAEMDTTTQQNAVLVQESSVAATTLEDQSSKLQQMLQVFTLPGQAPKAKAAAPRSYVKATSSVSSKAAPAGDKDWESF